MTASCHSRNSAVRGNEGGGVTLRQDRRGGMTIFIAALIPAMIAVGLLGLDAVRALSHAAQINYATQLAAIAAGASGNSYAKDGGATMQTYATTIAHANSALLSASNITVVAGTYNALSNNVNQGAGTPNAVQVTSSVSLSTVLGGVFGVPNLTITKSAISSIPTPTTAAGVPSVAPAAATVNILMLHDVGKNFNSTTGYPDLRQQLAADLAILNCLHSYGSANSKFGMVGFTLDTGTAQSMKAVGTSYASLYATLTTAQATAPSSKGTTALPYCEHGTKGSGPPSCVGSDVASGLYSAISLLNAAATQNSINHIVIITDQLPTVDPLDAPLVAGVKAAGTDYSTLAKHGGWVGAASAGPASCSTNCTNLDLIKWARAQAALAGAANMVVSTVYFSGDATAAAQPNTPGTGSSPDTEIASWVQNGGFHVNAANASDIPAAASNVCQYFGSRLKAVGA